MVDKVKPEGCWAEALYLDQEEYMGLPTVRFNDGKAEALAKQCAEYLSDENTQYQATHEKVACTSDYKVGNLWGWKVARVPREDEPPADCDTNVSYLMYDNAKKCAKYLEKIGKGRHAVSTLAQNIGDGYKPVYSPIFRVDKAKNGE